MYGRMLVAMVVMIMQMVIGCAGEDGDGWGGEDGDGGVRTIEMEKVAGVVDFGETPGDVHIESYGATSGTVDISGVNSVVNDS